MIKALMRRVSIFNVFKYIFNQHKFCEMETTCKSVLEIIPP